jgi:hypothetical protein
MRIPAGLFDDVLRYSNHEHAYHQARNRLIAAALANVASEGEKPVRLRQPMTRYERDRYADNKAFVYKLARDQRRVRRDGSTRPSAHLLQSQ